MQQFFLGLLTTSLAFSFFSSTSTHASDVSVLASCGSSSGHSYFHSNTFVPEDEAGWSEDRLPEGSIIVELREEQIDLLYRDKLGINSAKDHGAEIISAYVGESSLLLVVVYPDNGVAETYNFQHLGSDNAEVSWTSSKAATLINKSAVFYAKCSN